MTSKAYTAFSAPGKVLLAGGYLVVDRAHTGLVFGLDARIHVLVEPLATSSGVTLDEIIVRSPQFKDAEWRYGYRVVEDNGSIEVVQLKGHSTAQLSRNTFVETALSYALTYVSSHVSTRITPASITILADSDYYSQSQTSTKCPRNANSPFMNFNVALSEAHKTGLGSSAALVTAFVAAVLGHYLPTSREPTNDGPWRAKVHNLAQAVHCTAQGKIGSGFDVAAAVYGSCIYRRFSPTILERLGAIGDQDFSTRLRIVVDGDTSAQTLDAQIDESIVTMPGRLRLIMCDVDCGSETPGMVKRVFGWRKEKPREAHYLWETLQNKNNDLVTELQELSYQPNRSFGNLRNIILTIRSLIRDMTRETGVPIEPNVQKDLLDRCSQVEGVIGGVVPGAGGYDAIALVVENREEVVDKLATFLDSYSPSNVTDTQKNIGKVRLLRVKQEMEGLRDEMAAQFEGWLV